MQSKIRHFLLFCLWTCFLLFITGQLIRRHTIAHDNYISFLIFTLIVFLHAYASKKMSAKAVLYYYLSSFAVVYLIVTTIEGWRDSRLGMPNMLFVVLGMISGYIVYTCWKQRSYGKLIFPVLFLCMALTQAFVLHSYWLHFLNYGTFTPKVKESLKISPAEKEQLFKDKNKLYLLDFWSTSCGVCFKKFPKVQALYDQYKNNDKIEILTVNIRLPKDTNRMAQQLIVNRGYSFPVFVTNENFKNNFGVAYYPTVVMVKGDQIVFRGDIEGAKTFLENL